MAAFRKTQAKIDAEPEDQPETSDELLVEVVHIEGNLSDDLALIRPIGVEIWVEDGEYVADVADLDLHAFGATREEAIANARQQIAVHYQRLCALGDHLSPLMMQEAARIRAVVLPNRA